MTVPEKAVEALREITERASAALADFFRLEAAGGLLLLVAAAVGMVCANSPLAPLYDQLLAMPVTVTFGKLGVDKPLLYWINDGLMAVFFLLVGLEMKRELMAGQFADRAQILLPLACAIGGMAAPMLVYAALNHDDSVHMQGIAIPAATDIAFALGVLSLLGSRVPLALKMLLTAIAVLDDLGAIVIIALFYTSELSVASLTVALLALTGLIALNRAGVARTAPYIVLGTIMWLAVLKSGVHATLAGVALGMTIPLASRDGTQRPLERVEHGLHPWVAYAILPLFAFANAGVSLSGIGPATLLHPVPMGIALGLLLGKPLGVFGLGGLCVALRLARLPDGVNWWALLGMAVLCGIGFTMSLFIGALAFGEGAASVVVSNRVGILGGSLAAALIGYGVLRAVLPRVPPAPR